MLYVIECWAIKRYHVQKISVAEMRMLRWMCGNIRRDKKEAGSGRPVTASALFTACPNPG